MKAHLLAVLMSLSVGLSGCGNLQQAPLVYTSKVSVGIDAATTSTETPGFSINVGYKQVDAAYVPVAVAKDCKAASDQLCKEKVFEILPLNGNNDVSGTTKVSERALSDAKAALDAASTEVERNLTKLGEAQTDAKAKIKARDIAKTAADSAADVDKVTSAEAAKKAQNEVDSAQAAVADLQRSFDRAQAKLTEAAAAYSKLTAPSSVDSLNQRRDAFSVYGSFDGKTTNTGGKEGVSVGLNLGRTFSTGVASQNLTEGVRSSACLESAIRVLDKAGDKVDAALVKSLVGLCESRSR